MLNFNIVLTIFANQKICLTKVFNSKEFKMKRKITFFGICALFCALVISLGSCQKDWSTEIDQLKTDVAANKTAIAALRAQFHQES